MIKIDKIILGTAQFGLSYGINNVTGVLQLNQIKTLLNEASKMGVLSLDTADAYGDSSFKIGSVLEDSGIKFNLYSKFIFEKKFNLKEYVDHTLSLLKSDLLCGYSFHRFSDYLKISREVPLLEDRVKKIGVSLYSLEEFDQAIQDPRIGLIQLPFNYFDSSKKKIELIKMAKDEGKEIHVRSIFLQGLFFKPLGEFPQQLHVFKKPLKKLQSVCAEANISIQDFLINYPYIYPEIDGIIIGVDNLPQLEKNLDSLKRQFDVDIYKQVKMDEIPQGLLNPTSWRLD